MKIIACFYNDVKNTNINSNTRNQTLYKKHFTIHLFIFFTILFLTMHSTLSKDPPELEYNQLWAYPNTFEPPTKADYIGNTNYTAPLLSRSLFEENPRGKLRPKEFLEVISYTQYQMTRGETEQIFVFADKNHDNLIDQEEWDAFTALFILPFESCDANGDYLLDPEEYKICWEADPKTKRVEFQRRYNQTKYEKIMDVVETRGKPIINFSDYLFIRRSLFAWLECHSGVRYIAASAFKCALRTAIPNKYHLKLDHEKIYYVGVKLSNDAAIVDLEYIGYLRILYYTYYFAIFSLPYDKPYLEKSQFLKAKKEDRFPTNFGEEEINILYEISNTSQFQKQTAMSFESFSFFFLLHRLFNKYSKRKPMQLDRYEVNNMLNDDLMPYAIVLSVDQARTNFTEPQYLEVSMILHRLRLNERDFYYSFKSKDTSMNTNELGIGNANMHTNAFSEKNAFKEKNTNSEKNAFTGKNTNSVKNTNSAKSTLTSQTNLRSKTATNTNTNMKSLFKQDASVLTASINNPESVGEKFFSYNPNHTARVVFFTSMCGIDKRYWDKAIFYRAFLWANLFTSQHLDKRWVIPVQNMIHDMPGLYDMVYPPIGQLYRGNLYIFKSIPPEISIDIISFIELQNYQYKFALHTLNIREPINEVMLKIVLKDYGMENMPDTIIDLAKKGYDTFRRRIYKLDEVIKYVIIIQTAAAENIRNKEYRQVFQLKVNDDPSRKFLDFGRRFKSSPRV